MLYKAIIFLCKHFEIIGISNGKGFKHFILNIIKLLENLQKHFKIITFSIKFVSNGLIFNSIYRNRSIRIILCYHTTNTSYQEWVPTVVLC